MGWVWKETEEHIEERVIEFYNNPLTFRTDTWKNLGMGIQQGEIE